MSLLMVGSVRPHRLFGVLLLAFASACASSGSLRRGQSAELRQDYDLAIVEYNNVLRRHPDDRNARVGLDRAKLRSSAEHFQRGRRFVATGKLDQALVELELASELNPASGDVEEQLRDVRLQLRAKVAVAREGKTELQTIIERTRDLPPYGYELPTDVKMPESLILRDATSRDAFLTVARLAGISIIFDPTFREAPVSVDLRNASLESALSAIADATRSFFRVTSQRTVLVIPDTPAKRREYEEEVVRTFYLSNADLKETQDLLRIVLDARRISPTTATNAITVKDSPERVAAASRVIAAIDKARPEVVIDVELLEVDRTRLLEYGLQIASPDSPGINGSVSIDPVGGKTTLQALTNLSQSDILMAGLPSLYYRLLRSDGNTRILANPQLRTAEGTAATAKFGERIPVPVTTFVPIAQGGAQQQPIVSYNYENIGVNIDITPRLHHDDDVTLALKVSVQSISGVGFGGLPTFGNREVNNVIRLRDGETNMLAGLIRDDERRTVDGIPGLSDLPMLGRVFGHTKTETTQTDIILTITPHIVRVLDIDEGDLRAFRVGRDSLVPVPEIALPIELQRQPAVVPGQNQAQPGPTVQPATPLQPPTPAPPPPNNPNPPAQNPPPGR
jgi:general secretion pathway protein D